MWAIGVDVGGSKTSIGLIDTATGGIEMRAELPTPPLAEAGQTFLESVAQVARCLSQAHGDAGKAAVGIGICELVHAGGEVVTSHRVCWSSSQIRSAFSFAGHVAIEADARAAAIAEAIHGAGAGLRHWIYANAGTGIATVLMNGASPYLGAHGRALASGMGPASFQSHVKQLSVEDISGGAGMLARARACGLKIERFSELLDLDGDSETEGAPIIEEGGAVLGRALGFLANALDPEAIVLGGGIARASPVYAKAVETTLLETIWFKDAGFMGIRAARLGADSGLIGAAMVAAPR